jgi:hypothetical protein
VKNSEIDRVEINNVLHSGRSGNGTVFARVFGVVLIDYNETGDCDTAAAPIIVFCRRSVTRAARPARELPAMRTIRRIP